MNLAATDRLRALTACQAGDRAGLIARQVGAKGYIKACVFDLLIDVRVDVARRFIELFTGSCGLIHKSGVLFPSSVGFFSCRKRSTRLRHAGMGSCRIFGKDRLYEVEEAILNYR
jgi:hypothetical protein